MMGNLRQTPRRRANHKSLQPAFELLDRRLCLAAVVAPPAISISNASLMEGDSGERLMSFVVSLSSRPQQAASVRFQTSDGTAVAGKDYVAASGTVTFSPFQSAATISVPIKGDTLGEPDETFNVTLSNPVNCSCGTGTVSATGTIRNDDSPVTQVFLAGPVAAVLEGSSARFTCTLSAPVSQAVSVSYATSDLTAMAGSDYQASSGVLVFAAGEVSKTLDVAIKTDGLAEADETFQLRLLSVSGIGVTLGTPSTAVATIRDIAPPATPADPAGSWTILVYMTGENLNTYARDDINEMEKGLTSLPGSVKIVVAWDQPKAGTGTSYATGGGSQAAWRTFGRSVLTPDADVSKIASTFDLTSGEKNTGDPATLIDFVRWGVQQAPARHYLLQMWGHGGGLLGSQFDSESGSDPLTIGEIGTALSAPGMPRLDLLSYDNCLMAMAEVGAAIAPQVTGVFVASEETINGPGQDYTTAYAALKTADPGAVTAAQLAAGMVESYGRQYAGDFWGSDTFSAVTTATYGQFLTAISQFVATTTSLTAGNRTTLLSLARTSVTYSDSSFRDLGSFMAGVASSSSLPTATRNAAAAVNASIQAIVSAKTADQRSSAGVAIYLPTSANDYYLGSYASLAAAFCRATNWQTFALWLATGNRGAIASVGSSPSAGRVAGSPSRQRMHTPNDAAFLAMAQADAVGRADAHATAGTGKRHRLA